MAMIKCSSLHLLRVTALCQLLGYDHSLLAMIKYSCYVQILDLPRDSLLAMIKYSTVSLRYCMIGVVSGFLFLQIR